MVEILKDAKHEYPIYADKTFPPEPDFITYDANGNRYTPVEVSEVIPSGSKRSDEYKRSKNLHQPTNYPSNVPIADAWITLRSRLQNKFLKSYGQFFWVIVYFDILYHRITPYGFWHKAVLENAKSWFSDDTLGLSKCPYERVFVIDSDGRAMVSLFPRLEVIVPED